MSSPAQPFTLGRVVEHDPASLAHPAPVATAFRSVLWAHRAPVLDQGQRSSCTGNAAAQLFNSDVYAPERKRLHGGNYLTEDDAVRLYSAATKLDAFPGTYPPDDTGSSGLAVAKAAKTLGYIKAYKHAFGLQHLIGALQINPVIVGTDWYESMFTPDATGFLHPSGNLAGGHEYVVLGCNLQLQYFEFLQSWGEGWGIKGPEGVGGRFRITFADYDPLLKNQGDVTVLAGAP